MGTEIGKQSSALIDALLASPKKYSFVQAVRLLALHSRHTYGSELAFLRNGLKVIPELTLGHPSTDLVAAKALPAPQSEDYFPYTTKVDTQTTAPDTTDGTANDVVPNTSLNASYTQSSDGGISEAYDALYNKLYNQAHEEKIPPDSIEAEAKAARARILGLAPSENVYEVQETNLPADSLRPFQTFKEYPSYELTATFLALYGTASPLPTFYTEELIEEARNDRSGSRDFLDIFNQALYTLYYRAFQRYKLGLRTLEQQDESVLQMQYCLLGYGGDAMRTAAHTDHAHLRFINLFLRRHRSAHALCLGLRWHLQIENINIEECVLHKVPVPQDQLCRLGSEGARLGDAVVGKNIFDRQGKFHIILRELSMKQMQDLSPQGSLMQKLQNFVQQYVMGPLEYDVLLYATAQKQQARGHLGTYSLGRSAFLFNASRALPRVRHYLSRH